MPISAAALKHTLPTPRYGQYRYTGWHWPGAMAVVRMRSSVCSSAEIGIVNIVRGGGVNRQETFI